MNTLLPKNHYFHETQLKCYEKSVIKKKKFIPSSTVVSFRCLVMLETRAFKTHFGDCNCHEFNMTDTRKCQLVRFPSKYKEYSWLLIFVHTKDTMASLICTGPLDHA